MANTAVTMIQQGDQYAIEVVVKFGDAVITPSDCDDMKIMFGGYEKSYLAGELTFENGIWYFPMTQEMSLSLQKGLTSIQAQFKKDGEIRGTPVYSVEVDVSIIREVWE